jgi:hypothetical protein
MNPPSLCRLAFAFLLLLTLPLASSQNSTFTLNQKFQIILLGTPDVSKMPLAPTDAAVWDVDLFDTPASTIQALKAAGKIVICYFSAGTVEDWREDYKDFPAADMGKVLPEWPGERWVRTGSEVVRDVMRRRVEMAKEKGCDAIDPDNIGTFVGSAWASCC